MNDLGIVQAKVDAKAEVLQIKKDELAAARAGKKEEAHVKQDQYRRRLLSKVTACLAPRSFGTTEEAPTCILQLALCHLCWS